MDNITILLTRHSIWNLPSTVIRLALPHSALALGRSSHAMIVDGDFAIEAKMAWMEGWKIKSGVRRVPLATALKGATIIATKMVAVPNAEAGLTWAREQVGKRYDFRGAGGLALPANRDWQEDGAWWCYELAAGAIHKAGRKLWAELGHITGREMMGVNVDQVVMN